MYKVTNLGKVSPISIQTLNHGNLKKSRHEYAQALMVSV